MGEWDKWVNESGQVHKVGLAIFGKIPLGDREAIKYNAALLKAASTAASVLPSGCSCLLVYADLDVVNHQQCERNRGTGNVADDVVVFQHALIIAGDDVARNDGSNGRSG